MQDETVVVANDTETSDVEGDNLEDPDAVDDEDAEEATATEDSTSAVAETNSTATTAPAQLNADTSTYITNPIVCKTLGSAILWENLSPEKYPIYVKDSLLNTNDDFDFGEFEELPDRLSESNAEAFVFTFTQPGIYVFSDSRN